MLNKWWFRNKENDFRWSLKYKKEWRAMILVSLQVNSNKHCVKNNNGNNKCNLRD